MPKYISILELIYNHNIYNVSNDIFHNYSHSILYILFNKKYRGIELQISFLHLYIYFFSIYFYLFIVLMQAKITNLSSNHSYYNKFD